jgi:hypothetical protein
MYSLDYGKEGRLPSLFLSMSLKHITKVFSRMTKRIRHSAYLSWTSVSNLHPHPDRQFQRGFECVSNVDSDFSTSRFSNNLCSYVVLTVIVKCRQLTFTYFWRNQGQISSFLYIHIKNPKQIRNQMYIPNADPNPGGKFIANPCGWETLPCARGMMPSRFSK